MHEIYYVQINDVVSEEKIEYFKSFLSAEKQERLDRFHFRADMLRTLYGEVLMRYVMCKRIGVQNHDLQIEKNEYGKPYLKNHNLQYNISHSGNMVICAISNNEVGVDIEEIKDMDIEIVKRCYSEKEAAYIIEQQGNVQLREFYRIWTLKEAYVKYLGVGIHKSFDSFSFDEKVVSGSEFRFQENGKTVYFKQYDLNGYMCSVCHPQNEFPEQMKWINVCTITF